MLANARAFAIEAHRAYIQEETLADSLELGTLAANDSGEAYSESFKVEGAEVTVSLRRA